MFKKNTPRGKIYKYICVVVIEIFIFTSIVSSCPSFPAFNDIFLLRRIRGGVSVPGVTGFSPASESELLAYLSSLGITQETVRGLGATSMEISVIDANSDGIPEVIKIGDYVTIESSIEGWKVTTTLNSGEEVPFRFVGDTLHIKNPNGSTALINSQYVEQVDEDSVSGITYDFNALPDFFSSTDSGQSLQGYLQAGLEEDGPTYGLDAMKDVGIATLVYDKSGNPTTVVVRYDEKTSTMQSLFYRGRQVLEWIRSRIKSGKSAIEAVDEAVDSGYGRTTKVGEGGEFVDKSKRGWILLGLSSAIAAGLAVLYTYAFMSVDVSSVLTQVLNYVCATVTGMLTYSMFRPAVARTLKGLALPFLNVQDLVHEVKEDPEVLEKGLQRDAMYVISHYRNFDVLEKALEATIQKNAEDIFVRGLMNGKFHVALMGMDSLNPASVVREIELIRDFTERTFEYQGKRYRYGDFITFSYFLRNPAHFMPEQASAKGWKWLTFMYLIDLVQNGNRLPTAYTESEFGRYQVPGDQPSFAGSHQIVDALLAKGIIDRAKAEQLLKEGFITFNQPGYVDLASFLGIPEAGGKGKGRINDFLIVDEGNIVEGPHDGNIHGDLLRWAAKVAWSEEHLTRQDGSPFYDMYVPRLIIPESGELKEYTRTLLEQLNALDDKQNLGYVIAEQWFYNLFMSSGKAWIKGDRFIEHVFHPIQQTADLPPLRQFAQRVADLGKTHPEIAKIFRPLVFLAERYAATEYLPGLGAMVGPNMTSHDHWESFVSACMRMLDIIVLDDRPETIPKSVDQSSRFVYGDATKWYQKDLPASPFGDFLRKVLGLGKVDVTRPSAPEHHLEHKAAAVEYAFGDARFLGFIAWQMLMAYLPGYMDLQNLPLALGVGAFTALFAHSIMPKLIVPLITDWKTQISPRLETAFASGEAGEILKAIGSGFWALGKDTALDFPLSLLGDWFVYMPMVLIKPYLLAKNIIYNKVWKEFIGGERTWWIKPVHIALEGAAKEWKKMHLDTDRIFSNVVVPLMGYGLFHLLSELLGPDWRWMGAPLFVSWMAWPMVSNAEWGVRKITQLIEAFFR
ncbi:MAG: hypothetical protein NC818_00130 [Candidatus Omnitrophica bacterium]|nr:hypothetical protein [Candidatus Omnitrophota bacterium]